jgi:hypothetical protein
MNIKRAFLAVFILSVVVTACKKTEAPQLVKLVVTRGNGSTVWADSTFSLTVEAKDADGGNQVLKENTTITLSLLSGSGQLTGTLSQVMKAPENIVTFPDLKYDSVENDILILVSASNTSLGKTLCTLNVTGHMLVFKFVFDSTQTRYDNFGNPSPFPDPGNGAQSPRFNKMSAHYIELAPNDLTPLGQGKIIYEAPEVPDTVTGVWPTAIDFDQSVKVGSGTVFFRYPLKKIVAGSYKWLRLSLAYQNFDITYRVTNPLTYIGTGTVASFIGYDTYIHSYIIKTVPVNVDGPRLQGYWGFETNIPTYGIYSVTGQAPANSTTVVNPNPSSPIPQGSCVVTGAFTNTLMNQIPIYITGDEHSDIIVTVSVSTNNSFEWVDSNANGYYEPAFPENEAVVDMGVRGIIPIVQY